ncbi:hypothetical protein, partial [Streptomyces sp. SID161]|uniref:hypothetical protein n=1 Tax=Streptomyces sp. SID161 TaxID=2690251 RepID=UPI001F212365
MTGDHASTDAPQMTWELTGYGGARCHLDDGVRAASPLFGCLYRPAGGGADRCAGSYRPVRGVVPTGAR